MIGLINFFNSLNYIASHLAKLRLQLCRNLRRNLLPIGGYFIAKDFAINLFTNLPEYQN